MSASSWLAGNASLEAAHNKYGTEFEDAFVSFKRHAWNGVNPSELEALWRDHENRGENIMAWYRARKC